MTHKSAVSAMVSAMALTAWLVVPARAQERERTVPTRAFDRFELESETGVGFWAEAGALYERQQDVDTAKGETSGFHSTTAFARFAYGDKKWEAGAFIPYLDVKGNQTLGRATTDVSDNGVGDILLAGKYVPIQSDILDLGAGAALSLPSGDHKRGVGSGGAAVGVPSAGPQQGLGAGELGGLPFITGAFHMAVADVRAHLGGEFFTGSSHGGAASDRLVYGFGIFLPLCNYAALRNEFSGTNVYDAPDEPKIVNYLPGLDLRLPIGNLDALLRITGAVGVSSRAPSWGAGGSLVISSPTLRAPVAKGGVVIE
jgi:hypothetical protein